MKLLLEPTKVNYIILYYENKCYYDYYDNVITQIVQFLE